MTDNAEGDDGRRRVRASRRQVLSLAGLTLGIGVVSIGGNATPAAARAPEPDQPDVRLEPVAEDLVTALTAESGAVVMGPRQLAVRVVTQRTELPRGTTLTMTFDPRLYAALESPFVTLGGRTVPITSTITTDDKSGTTTCAVVLQQDVPLLQRGAEAMVVVIGAANAQRYPLDLVHQPRAVVAEIPKAGRRPGARRELGKRAGAPAANAMPWGIELSGCWSRQVWGVSSEFVYYHPVRVTLTGVGPAAAPAPATFTVALDPRLVGHVAVTAVRLNGKAIHRKAQLLGQQRDAVVYESRWRTPVALKAGDVLDVDLNATLLTPSGPLTTIKHPIVSLDGFSDAAAQRRTGRSELTRQDSVWE